MIIEKQVIFLNKLRRSDMIFYHPFGIFTFIVAFSTIISAIQAFNFKMNNVSNACGL